VNVIPGFTLAFRKRNFTLNEPDLTSKKIVYHGILSTKKYEDVEIDFVFDDDAFITFPHAIIGINSRNKFKPFHFPHLDASWSLCYHDDSKIFDRYNPEGMVNFCIGNTQNVLDETKKDDMTEILKEFPRYWDAHGARYYSFLTPNDTIAYMQKFWILSPNICFKMVDIPNKEVPIFRLTDTPSIADIEWPLEKYSAFMTWISKVSPETENEIRRYIKTMISKKHSKIMFIIYFEDINLYLGLTIEYINSNYNLKVRANLRQETVDSIFNGKHIFHRFTVDNYNAEKIIKSNVSPNSLTLINKKILLVGVGTIGSNLSNFLVKNGAGIGEEALFTIIDDDEYEPYNYSRHFLGIKYSGCNKTMALKIELEYAFPFTKIDAIEKPIQNMDISYYDIIIDSTGEEAVTQWLNEKIKTNNLCNLFISAWIHGQGVAAQCFVQPNNNKACHECLKKSEHYYLEDLSTLPLRDSCNSIYIPFPITASMYAVLLVIHALNKWLGGQLTETTFFTQVLNPVGEIKETIIIKSEECPLCGKD
jgi:molybdopterin/thiamine biosynthesis adenylyltransferase